jgi:ribosomal protein S18 acetylase RimI-like enzyme
VAVGRLYLGVRDEEVRIIDISLLPSARGQGLGGAILADILAAADAAGRKVSIHVEWANPARRLYHRLGFIAIEDGGVYLRMERLPRRPVPTVPESAADACRSGG